MTEYKVPGEIAAALATGRTQFLDLLIARLDNGEGIPDDDVEEFVRFAVELVRVRVHDGERMRKIHETLTDLREAHKSVLGQWAALETKFAALSKTLIEFETLAGPPEQEPWEPAGSTTPGTHNQTGGDRYES